MKFKQPVTVYCSAYAAIGVIVCGWLLISEGIVLPLGLALAFFFIGSSITSALLISDTVWGRQMRQVSNDYRTEASSKEKVDKDLFAARRVLIGVAVVSAALAIPVFIKTWDSIQI